MCVWWVSCALLPCLPSRKRTCPHFPPSASPFSWKSFLKDLVLSLEHISLRLQTQNTAVLRLREDFLPPICHSGVHVVPACVLVVGMPFLSFMISFIKVFVRLWNGDHPHQESPHHPSFWSCPFPLPSAPRLAAVLIRLRFALALVLVEKIQEAHICLPTNLLSSLTWTLPST